MISNSFTAGAVVFKDDFILMIRTNDGWQLPKGRSKPGESPGETALREVKEETGITISIYSRLGGYLTRSGRPFICFLGRPLFGSPTPQEEEGISEVEWVKKKKSLKMIVPHQKEILAQALSD